MGFNSGFKGLMPVRITSVIGLRVVESFLSPLIQYLKVGHGCHLHHHLQFIVYSHLTRHRT